MRAMVVAGLVCVAGAAGAASYTDGNYLYRACLNTDDVTQGFCIGFIMGTIEGIRYGLAYPMMMQGDKSSDEVNATSNVILMNCPPEGIENGQYVDVAINYLHAHPADRHNSARALILESLQDAFPCPVD